MESPEGEGEAEQEGRGERGRGTGGGGERGEDREEEEEEEEGLDVEEAAGGERRERRGEQAGAPHPHPTLAEGGGRATSKAAPCALAEATLMIRRSSSAPPPPPRECLGGTSGVSDLGGWGVGDPVPRPARASAQAAWSLPGGSRSKAKTTSRSQKAQRTQVILEDK